MLRKLAGASALLCALLWATTAGAVVCSTTGTAGFADAATVAALNEICSYVSGAQPAGETHIGETGNNQTTITVAQTVTASSAYATGNAVGGLITFSGAARVSGSAGAAGTSGLLQSITVHSKSAQTTQMDLLLFDANPTGSTCTDKTAVSVASADSTKWKHTVHITDWTSGGTDSNGQAENLAVPYALASSTTLYGCLVTRSTPTFSSTSDISVSAIVIRN